MADPRAAEFDYESVVWGEEALVPGERTIAGYRLGEVLWGLPHGGRVMELGCGGGRFLRGIAAARPALRLVGIDLSQRPPSAIPAHVVAWSSVTHR
jgi:tRNA G46 methylase TrmB